MASWLDILAQDNTDAKGRFNPFGLARGFSKKGRQEIDEKQALGSAERRRDTTQANQANLSAPVLAELQRAQAKAAQASTGRRESAIAESQMYDGDIDPNTPEAADVLQSLLGVDTTRLGQQNVRQGMQVQRAQEGRQAEQFSAQRPYMGDMARLQKEGAEESVAGARQDRVQQGTRGPLQDKLLTEQIQALANTDPRIRDLLTALESEEFMDPNKARALQELIAGKMGPSGQQFMNTAYPPQQVQDTSQADALNQSIEALRQQGVRQPTQPGQAPAAGAEPTYRERFNAPGGVAERMSPKRPQQVQSGASQQQAPRSQPSPPGSSGMEGAFMDQMFGVDRQTPSVQDIPVDQLQRIINQLRSMGILPTGGY